MLSRVIRIYIQTISRLIISSYLFRKKVHTCFTENIAMSVCCKLIYNSYNGCLHLLPIVRTTPAFTPVRWRMPRWVPRGKTKEFVISERPPINHEEQEFMKPHTFQYNTKMKSIRAYLVGNIPNKTLNTKVEMTRHDRFEIAWKTMHEQNNAWNAEVAKIREKRQNAEEAERQRMYEDMLEKDRAQILDFWEKAEERLQYEKESSKSFIVPENVDEEIEKVLDSKIDYEYALNQDGYRIMEQPLPSSKTSSETESLSDT